MNIFVAGLSYQITDADLKELFEGMVKYPQLRLLPIVNPSLKVTVSWKCPTTKKDSMPLKN